MFHIIGVLFFIGLFVLFIGLILASKLITSIVTFIRSIFNPNQQQKGYNSESFKREQNHEGRQNNRQSKSGEKGKKIFGDDEGEYIEFEEIKD